MTREQQREQSCTCGTTLQSQRDHETQRCLDCRIASASPYIQCCIAERMDAIQHASPQGIVWLIEFLEKEQSTSTYEIVHDSHEKALHVAYKRAAQFPLMFPKKEQETNGPTRIF
jgi:hypothetical protein